MLELFSEVRRAWPAAKPLGVRLSVTDGVAGGWDIADSVALACELRALGCDYIAASSGGMLPDQAISVRPGYQVPLSSRVRAEAHVATMAVGLITEPHQAEDILEAGDADFIALGRTMLADPRWPWRAAAELGVELPYPPQYERTRRSIEANFLHRAKFASTLPNEGK